MNKTFIILFIGLVLFLVFAGCVQQEKQDQDNQQNADTAKVQETQQELGTEATNLDSTLQDLENAEDDLTAADSELDLEINEEEIQ